MKLTKFEEIVALSERNSKLMPPEIQNSLRLTQLGVEIGDEEALEAIRNDVLEAFVNLALVCEIYKINTIEDLLSKLSIDSTEFWGHE